MSSYVKRVVASLPYSVPGSGLSYVVVDVALDRLSVLVGPNASGRPRFSKLLATPSRAA
ncbi:MAG: hypothetical protein GXO32_04775 [Crenarchaeota archaeon]|nr:hypothetical protein [Thermoproteota archaeon]